MRRLLLLLIPLLLISGCGERKRADAKPVVFVTIEPLRYFTERIAGDLVDVQVMVPSGSSPETYEPTPRQMMSLSRAAAYITVGQIGFERTWMDRLREQAPHMAVCHASAGVRMAVSSEGTEDPHTWMSCQNAQVMANNIMELLAKILPAHKQTLRENHLALSRRIEEVDQQIRASLRGQSFSFAIYHPMLTYFARDYHLRQYPIEEEGREPSARQTQLLIDRLRQDTVRVIFSLKEFNTATIRSIADATQAQVVDINPLSAQWDEEMLHVAKSLR